ncbi:MAG: MalM family protein [Thermoanaerobaculia bacterium]
MIAFAPVAVYLAVVFAPIGLVPAMTQAAASSPPQSTAPPATPVEQPSPSPSTEAATVPDTARALAKRGLVMEISGTAEAEIEADIAADQERFALPFGPSPAVLIRLPDYRAPFTLTISSYPSKGFHKNVFVPIAVFLDADFKTKHELAETEFKWKSMTFGRQHFESTVSIEDAQRADRYVLIFTNGSRTRELLSSGAVTSVTPHGAVSVPSSFARSFWGDVRLEVRPQK